MHKVKNAIILAAGRGSRLKHLTKDVPKPLLAPKGVKFIDGIIKNLKEKGLNNIYVITGYLSKEFDYLKSQGIKLIHNNEWDEGNNVTSIKFALPFLGDSLIINGDIIMKSNVFETSYPSSLTYVERDSHIDEWITILDEKGNVNGFDKKGRNKEGLYQREIIFVSSKLADAIKEDITNFDMQEYQEFLMLYSSQRLGIPFGIHEVPKGTIFDLDTIDEFNNYKNTK